MPTFVLAFDSTHAAIAAQDRISPVAFRVIPTPREITAGCGISLLFEAPTQHEAIDIARAACETPGLQTIYRKKDAKTYVRLEDV
jgi:hypothetical protein